MVYFVAGLFPLCSVFLLLGLVVLRFLFFESLVTFQKKKKKRNARQSKPLKIYNSIRPK